MLERYAQFSFVISGIYRQIQKIQREEMEKLGYKGAFAPYLVVLDRHPQGMTAAHLCEEVDRDKAAVSRVVARMEALGLVEKGEGTYRAALLLTDKGREAARWVADRAVIAVAEAGKVLSAEERRAFYRALEQIAGSLQNLSKHGLPPEAGKE